MRKTILLLLLVSLILSSCAAPEKKDNEAQNSKPINQQQTNNTVTPVDKVEEVETGITEGKMAPDFTLKNTDDKEVKLSDYRGKTVILNFFGVWCGWCKVEMPGFMKVYNENKEKNIELVVVDNGDSKETIVNYLKENKFDIKPLMDTENKVTRMFMVRGFPTTLIIDEKGIIKRVHTGYLEESAFRSLLAEYVK